MVCQRLHITSAVFETPIIWALGAPLKQAITLKRNVKEAKFKCHHTNENETSDKFPIRIKIAPFFGREQDAKVTKGQIQGGSISKPKRYDVLNLCVKFHTFITKCTIHWLNSSTIYAGTTVSTAI